MNDIFSTIKGRVDDVIIQLRDLDKMIQFKKDAKLDFRDDEANVIRLKRETSKLVTALKNQGVNVDTHGIKLEG